MKTDLPPLNWLKTFEAAARLLNFSAAARELYMTQSAVSQQIRLLEHHLGEPLFLRAHRKVTLTNSGLAYLPVVQGAIRSLQRNTAEIFSPVGKGRLVIEVSFAFSSLWLARNLHRFSARYPGIGLHIVHANWESEFDSATTDVVIMHGNGEWAGMEAQPLIRSELAPYCAPQLARLLSDPEDLISLPLLDIVGNKTRWSDWFAEAGLDISDRDIQLHRLDNALTASLMAESGLGVMLGYPQLMASAQFNDRLVAPFVIPVKTSDSYYLVTPEGKPLSKSATVFCQWLTSEMALIDSDQAAITEPTARR